MMGWGVVLMNVMGNMRKVALMTLVVLLMLAIAVLLQGCGEVAPVASGPGFPMTVTDDLGRQVTIDKEPQRIISLGPANTETLFALGLGDKVAGVSEYCDYPAEAREKPKMGGFSTPNAELIVAAQPDLVLAVVMQEEYVRQLEDAGLTVIAIEPLNLEQVFEKVKLVGQVTGVTEAADNLVADMQRRVDVVTAKVSSLSEKQKPTVFFEIWPDPLTTGGAKSFINSLIVTAGGKNIADDIEQDWVTYSLEILLARNPEIIIFSHHGDSRQTVEQIQSRKGWEQVSAIKQGRVSCIEDQNLVVRAGPRVVEGLETIAKIIHPELFE